MAAGVFESFDYIEMRLKPQLAQFEKSSKKLEKSNQTMVVANIVLAALIPVTALIGIVFQSLGTSWLNVCIVFTAIFGALSSICMGARMHGKYHDRAVQHQMIHDKMESELAKYASGVFYYNIADEKKKMEILVSFCEATMRDEYNQWEELMSQK